MGHDPSRSMALAAAVARAGRDIVVVEPKSMQETSAQPKPVVVVDDTKAPVDPELQVKPKSSCRHCYGRGYVGTDFHTKKKIICRCVKKDFARVNKVKQERDREIKDAQVTASKGWDEPKAPVGNINAPAAQ